MDILLPLISSRKSIHSFIQETLTEHQLQVKLNSESYGHVWMWELDHKEDWAQNNWCFWTVVLEKTLESPLDCKEIQPVNPKWNQSQIFIGGTDAETEVQILGHLMQRADSLEKNLMLGKIEGKRRRGWQRTRWLDAIIKSMNVSLSKLWEMVKDREAWLLHPWNHKESDTTEWLNNHGWSTAPVWGSLL